MNYLLNLFILQKSLGIYTQFVLFCMDLPVQYILHRIKPVSCQEQYIFLLHLNSQAHEDLFHQNRCLCRCSCSENSVKYLIKSEYSLFTSSFKQLLVIGKVTCTTWLYYSTQKQPLMIIITSTWWNANSLEENIYGFLHSFLMEKRLRHFDSYYELVLI